MKDNFGMAFETLAKLRDSLNTIEDELKSISHLYPRQAKSEAFRNAMDQLYAFRDSLWRLDKHFENGGGNSSEATRTMLLDGRNSSSPTWNIEA